MTGFIVVAIDTNDSISYISNTSPIIWSSDISDVKIFESYRFAKNELEDNFISLSVTISYTNIHSIWILEYKDNVEIGREKFI